MDRPLKTRARELRKNMTRQECHLWYDYLRTCPIRFLRQKVLGNYIVDFYCPRAKLVVEIDGAQHYTLESMEYDRLRTAALEQNGIQVLRFLNRDVDRNFEGVCQTIEAVLKQRVLKK